MIHFAPLEAKKAVCGNETGLYTDNHTLVECPVCQQCVLGIELERRIRELKAVSPKKDQTIPLKMHFEQKVAMAILIGGATFLLYQVFFNGF